MLKEKKKPISKYCIPYHSIGEDSCDQRKDLQKKTFNTELEKSMENTNMEK